MNDTFQLNRFSVLFKKMLNERWLHLVGAFILNAIFVWYIYLKGGDIPTNQFYSQIDAYFIGLCFCGIAWTATCFNYFSNTAEGYGFIMLPASYFEKWLCNVVLLTLFIILFSIYFRVLDTAYVAYFRSHIKPNSIEAQHALDLAHVMSFNPFNNHWLRFPYFIFFNTTALIAVGSLYFNKLSVVKTLLSVVAILFVISFIQNLVLKSLFDKPFQVFFFGERLSLVNENWAKIDLPQFYYSIYQLVFYILLPIALWFTALLRLKEKEI